MNWSKVIRQTHRWVSIVFAAVVIVVAILSSGGEEPAAWVYAPPLILLGILLLTGLYLFVLPWVGKGRGGSGSQET